MITLRREHPVFRKKHFFEGRPTNGRSGIWTLVSLTRICAPQRASMRTAAEGS